ncbi:hypothetical protein ACH47B_13190 [Rhodococcus sp. NPDC019627]|uniref:hypothetical protein n=1 Tax=unclassified Rhodococcus (in: high G+C Gram-positive bacteria) TaxID=192944 RepID=UPI00340A4763
MNVVVDPKVGDKLDCPGCGEVLKLDESDGWMNRNGLTCSPTNTTHSAHIRTITPETFGPDRYGVHLYSHEDDWGWTAFGHPHPRRLLAAINREVREMGVGLDLRDAMMGRDIEDGIKRRWAHNFQPGRFDEEFTWDWCYSDTPGAVPITVVNP